MTEPTASPHPLQAAFDLAIAQVTQGKGEERHGLGADFMAQPWLRNAKTHGRGFLTGQAAKKLEEAQSFTDPDKWEREMLGAIVYAGMAVLFSRMQRATKVPASALSEDEQAYLRSVFATPTGQRLVVTENGPHGPEILSSTPASEDKAPKADSRGHVMYTDTDADAPDSIRDRNGQVALSWCKRCGRAESMLDEPCFPSEQLTGFSEWRRWVNDCPVPSPNDSVAVHFKFDEIHVMAARAVPWEHVASYALRLTAQPDAAAPLLDSRSEAASLGPFENLIPRPDAR